jgi:hypothetical protein
VISRELEWHKHSRCLQVLPGWARLPSLRRICRCQVPASSPARRPKQRHTYASSSLPLVLDRIHTAPLASSIPLFGLHRNADYVRQTNHSLTAYSTCPIRETLHVGQMADFCSRTRNRRIKDTCGAWRMCVCGCAILKILPVPSTVRALPCAPSSYASPCYDLPYSAFWTLTTRRSSRMDILPPNPPSREEIHALHRTLSSSRWKSGFAWMSAQPEHERDTHG